MSDSNPCHCSVVSTTEILCFAAQVSIVEQFLISSTISSFRRALDKMPAAAILIDQRFVPECKPNYQQINNFGVKVACMLSQWLARIDKHFTNRNFIKLASSCLRAK